MTSVFWGQRDELAGGGDEPDVSAVPAKMRPPPPWTSFFFSGDSGIQTMFNSGGGSGFQFTLFLWVLYFVNNLITRWVVVGYSTKKNEICGDGLFWHAL